MTLPIVYSSPIMENPNNSFPLKNGSSFVRPDGRVEMVVGEITVSHDEPICYTNAGNWYRREDGEQMTRADGKIMTVKDFYKWCKTKKVILSV